MVKKPRGRPKQIPNTQEEKTKERPNNNKAIANLENKLTKLQKAETQYNEALQQLNNQVKSQPKPKPKATQTIKATQRRCNNRRQLIYCSYKLNV